MQQTEPVQAQETTSMPNKTIYVPDGDLPILHRAQELTGDSLSATITTAVRRLVETQQREQQGYKEITVNVGKVAPTPKRFVGRSLAKGQIGGRSEPRITRFNVFQTQKGRYALHTQSDPNPYVRGADLTDPTDYRLDVVGTLEELQDRMPTELYDAAVVAASDEGVEVLDI